MADGAGAGAQRRLQPGLGLHCFRALRTAGRIAQRTQPAQTRTALASSLAGCSGRSTSAPPRLAPQRQLRASAWRGGVSRRSSGLMGTAPEDPPSTYLHKSEYLVLGLEAKTTAF